MSIPLLLIIAAVVVVDQFTKAMAIRFLIGISTVPILPGIFHLTFVQNTGVAFGLLKDHQTMVLAGTTLLIGGLLVSTIRTHRGKGVLWTWSLGLILGGAIGNLIDRIRIHSVIDFLDFRIWPVFNVADSCITVGAFLVAWTLVRRA